LKATTGDEVAWRGDFWRRYHLYRREGSSRKTQNRHFSNISRTEDALCQISMNSVQAHSSYNHLAQTPTFQPVICLAMLTFASFSLPYVSRIKIFGSVNSTINCIHFLLMVMLFVGSFSQIKFEIQYHISFVLALLSTNNTLHRSTKDTISFTK
jgi:hypothetical protein